MKRNIILFLLLALGSLACEFDVCENRSITCMNGGVCDNGGCICPDGFSGEDCGQEADFSLKTNRTSLKIMDGGSFQVELTIDAELAAPRATFSTSDLPNGVEVSFDSASSSYGCTALVEVDEDFKSEAEIELIATTSSGTKQKATIQLINEANYDPRSYILVYPSDLIVNENQTIDFEIQFYNDGDGEWHDLKFHFEDLPNGCYVDIAPNPVSEGYTGYCTLHANTSSGYFDIKMVSVRTIGEHERKEYNIELIVN